VRAASSRAAAVDFVHARAVLMHVPVDRELLVRMVSWLRPNGWLLLEEPDFGIWLGDADPVWALGPKAWHGAFPEGSLSRGGGCSASCRGAGSPTSPPTPRSTSSGRGRRWPSSIS
jgi:methyltransferase family protein